MRSLLILTTLLLIWSCKEDPIDTQLIATYAGTIVGTQNTLLPEIKMQLVEKESGKGIHQVGIEIMTIGESGKVDVESVITDPDGFFTFHWTLGDHYQNNIRITSEGKSNYLPTSLQIQAIAQYQYQIPELDDDWQTGHIQNNGLEESLIQKGVDAIRRGDYTLIHDLVIAKNGVMVLAENFLPETTNKTGTNWLTRTDGTHYIASATKSIVSLATGIAIDQGFINGFDAKVLDFFPHYENINNVTPEKEEVSISDFLTMRHGFDMVDGDGKITPLNQAKDLVRFTLDLPMLAKPGSKWAYSSQCTNVMGDVIRLATNSFSFHSFLMDYLFGPLNIQVPEYILHTNSGKPMLGAGIFMDPLDMAKIGQLVLDDGVWNGTQLISKEWLDYSTAAVVDFGDGDYYAHHWWRRDSGNYNYLLAAGNGGQVIYILKEKNLVVVMTGGHYDSNKMRQHREILDKYITPAIL